MSKKKAPGKLAPAKGTQKPARSATKPAAKKSARPSPGAEKGDGESAVLAQIAAMPGPDRVLGERLHAIVRATAPALTPKLWYGMPAYARDGKIVCFFQSAQKFKTRYATFAFMHEANLDDGASWPTAFAVKELNAAEEAKIVSQAREESGELRRVSFSLPPRQESFIVRRSGGENGDVPQGEVALPLRKDGGRKVDLVERTR